MTRKDELLKNEIIPLTSLTPSEEMFLYKNGYKKIEAPNHAAMLVKVDKRAGDFYITPNGDYYRHYLVSY